MAKMTESMVDALATGTRQERAIRNRELYIRLRDRGDWQHLLQRSWRLGCATPDDALPILTDLLKAGLLSEARELARDALVASERDGRWIDVMEWACHFRQVSLKCRQRLNDFTVNELVRRAAKQLGAGSSLTRSHDGPLRVAYLVAEDHNPKSSVTRIAFEIAKLHDRSRVDPALFGFIPEGVIRQVNPGLVPEIEAARSAGIDYTANAELGSPWQRARQMLNALSGFEPDLLVTNMMIDEAYIVAAMRPCPIIGGIDWGHPEWYSAPFQDFNVSFHRHFAMETMAGDAERVELHDLSPVRSGGLGSRPEGLPPPGCPLLVSSGHLPKFTNPTFWNIVGEVLRELPEAHWAFVGISRDDVGFQGEDAEVLLARTRFLGFRSDLDDIIRCADLYVDTFPLGGGLTPFHAIRADVPCVVFRHDFSTIFDKSRSYAPFSEGLGSPDFVVDPEPSQIMRTILQLAREPDRAQDLLVRQKHVIARHSQPAEVARQLEAVFERRVTRGKRPRPS